MLANLFAAQLYSTRVWLPAASQRMTSNRHGVRSAADVTSPHRHAWPSPTVADALSTSQSRPCRRNCKILSNALLRCKLKSTHVKCWTQSTTNFWLLQTSWEGRSEGCQVDTVPMKSNCYGYYRRRRSLLSSSNRQLSDRVPLVPTSLLYNIRATVNSDLSLTWQLSERPFIADLTLTPRLSQPVVYTLTLTSWLWPRAAIFDKSTTPRSPGATSRPVAPPATASTPA